MKFARDVKDKLAHMAWDFDAELQEATTVNIDKTCEHPDGNDVPMGTSATGAKRPVAPIAPHISTP